MVTRREQFARRRGLARAPGTIILSQTGFAPPTPDQPTLSQTQLKNIGRGLQQQEASLTTLETRLSGRQQKKAAKLASSGARRLASLRRGGIKAQPGEIAQLSRDVTAAQAFLQGRGPPPTVSNQANLQQSISRLRSSIQSTRQSFTPTTLARARSLQPIDFRAERGVGTRQTLRAQRVAQRERFVQPARVGGITDTILARVSAPTRRELVGAPTTTLFPSRFPISGRPETARERFQRSIERRAESITAQEAAARIRSQRLDVLRPDILERTGGTIPARVARTAGQFGFGITLGIPETAEQLVLTGRRAGLGIQAEIGRARGFLRPEQERALTEFRQAGRQAVRTQFTSPEGLTSTLLAVGLVPITGGALSPAARAGVPRTTGVAGDVAFRAFSRTQARTTAARPTIPVRRTTTTLRFQEARQGGLNTLLGRTQQTRVRVSPKGTVTKTQSFGSGKARTKVVTTQRPGQPRATVKVTRRGQTTSREIPAQDIRDVGMFNVVEDTIRRQVEQPGPGTIIQSGIRQRVIDVTVPTGRQVLRGPITERVAQRQVSISRPRGITAQERILGIRRGGGVTVEGLITSPEVRIPTRLAPGRPRPRRERVTTRTGELIRGRVGLAGQDIVRTARLPFETTRRPTPVSFLQETIITEGILTPSRVPLTTRALGALGAVTERARRQPRRQPRPGTVPVDLLGEEILVARAPRPTAPLRDILARPPPKRPPPPRARPRARGRQVTTTRTRPALVTERVPRPTLEPARPFIPRTTFRTARSLRFTSAFAAITQGQGVGQVRPPRVIPEQALLPPDVIPGITTPTRPSQRQRQQQLTRARTRGAGTFLATVTRPRPITPVTPTFFPGIDAFPGGFPLAPFGFRRRRVGGRREPLGGAPRRAFQRTPTLVALEFNIFAPPGTRKTPRGGFLGLEFRGI